MSADEDGAGNLFILDDKDGCVKKFSTRRDFLERFGRNGQGPGEFQYPMGVEVAADGRVVVSTMSSEFHVFENDGTFVDHFRLPPYRGISPAVLGSDRIVAYAFQVNGENTRNNPVLAIFDFQGRVLLEFGEPYLLDTARRTWNANFLSLTVDGDENIYAAFSSLNRIEKYSPAGRLLLSIDRVLPYDVGHQYKKSSMDIGGRAVAVDEPDFTPVNRGIGVDSRGRIWVLSFQESVRGLQIPPASRIQDYLAFEIYSPEGALLSRVPFPPEVVKFDNMTMRGDHLFFVDPFDEACVYEYAVVDHGD
jgi:sugar lactone lactonase YvrE